MDSGGPGARRLFAEVGIEAGYPDGLIVDAEESCGERSRDGGRVTRYRPDGSMQRVVSLPVPPTTSCCFRGRDLAVLFVSSAEIGLDDAALGTAPCRAASSRVGVRGRPPHRFLG
jgi:sugar lactone lactonase YvrE